jgi:hypothetical protein
MRKLLIATPLIVLGPLLGLSACASASGQAKPADSGLMIPPPPPHVVPITPEPVVEPVSEIPGGTAPTSTNPSTRPGRGNRDTTPPRSTGSDTKPDAKPGTDVPAATEPAPATLPAPTGPPPQLRTAESPGTEGTVRAQIDRTRQMLSTVDYRRLTNIRKKAYDDAKKFADQADEALKQGNVVFAVGVAGKAETLAKELAGR